MTDPVRFLTALSLGEFAEKYWDRAPLLRRAAQLPADDWNDLLSRDAIDELLSRRGLRTPFVRMTRNGDIIPVARYTRGGGAGAEIADQVADERVLAELAAGATLVLQGLHRLWPPIVDFAHRLTTQLGHPVQVNAYVTPPMNQGFSPHYDVHDVFVLQFAGRKHWRVHEPVWRAPLRSQPWQDRAADIAARVLEPPLIATVLECGDVLYLPRGYVHAAASLGEISGHLTVGVHPLTRRTLIDRIVEALGNDEELRRSLPLGADLCDETELEDELRATIAALRDALDRLDRTAVARGIGRHLAAMTRPSPLHPLGQLAVAATVTPQTRVRLRSGVRVTVRTEGADVVLAALGDEFRLADVDAETVRTVTSGAIVAADAVASLDVDAATDMIARLLRAGIVVPA